MIFGFTGTTKGMTPEQLASVQHLFARLHVLHHGDAIGADSQAHSLAVDLYAYIVGHPGPDPARRAFRACDVTLLPKPFLKRNLDIVNAARDGVVAAPDGKIERFRGSGTWATIRYARRARRPLWIVWPDGTISQERFG